MADLLDKSQKVDEDAAELLTHTPADETTWRDAPIEPGWIVSGQPRARWASLARSPDGFSHTALWDCTAGVFRWRYSQDETVHILEGETMIASADGPPSILRRGDTYLFAAGRTYLWTVPSYVRKIAFFHQPVPRPAGLALHALRRLRDRASALRRAA